MRAQFYDAETHCIVCTNLVPPERIRFKSITCSDECARLRKLSMRAKQDARECRHCRKPSTMAERAAYQRYRKWEKANPQLAYPDEFKRWLSNSQGLGVADADASKFTLEIAARMAEEAQQAKDDEDERRAEESTRIAVGSAGEAGPEVRDSPAGGQ